MSPSPRRALCAALVATAAFAASAAGASAATLAQTDGTLTFTGSAAVNDVSFVQTATATVRVDRDTTDTPPDADPITAVPGNCTEVVPQETYDCTGVTAVVANTLAGNDDVTAVGLTSIPITVAADEGSDTATGGTADDDLDGGAGSDILDGAAGDDSLDGGADGDTLLGGSGTDSLQGRGGDDTMSGGTGDDFLFGGNGNDALRGDNGNDQLFGDPDNDDVRGGDGYDTMNTIPASTPPESLVVTLDDVANDRTAMASGEADNVHADVEGVDTEYLFIGVPSGDDTLIGSAAANTLRAGRGRDVVDGAAGNDVLTTGAGDDAVRARDGFADFVNCGDGIDTAEVDSLDTVQECETVSRTDVGSATEDRPPTIAITGPGPGALLRTNGPTTLTANVADDRGVVEVLFIDDERIVCRDTAAPYTCDYQPRGEDVGRNTLVAIAIDTAQQTGTAVRAFNVGRFAIAGITGAVTPARDRRRPFVFRTTGRLRLPSLVAPAVGCRGIVSVQIKAGAKTISTRRANVRANCAFTSVVRFGSRRRFTRTGRLRFTIRFAGNEVLGRSAAVARNVRTR